MNKIISTLDNVNINSPCKIVSLISESLIRKRLLDLGLIAGTTIKPVHIGPSNNPVAYLIRGTVVALRSEDTKKIIVELI